MFSAAQTLHPDAEDLLLYVILQVRIPQFLIPTDEYMVTTLSWYENDSLRCITLSDSQASQSICMQRRWLLVAMFHSSSRLLPHTVYAKSYLLWYILYICACCRFNGDACLSETSDHHRREETVKRGVPRLPGHDTGSSYFGSWVSVEASQKQRKSSKAPFKKINKGESSKASYLASTRQKKWRKKRGAEDAPSTYLSLSLF